MKTIKELLIAILPRKDGLENLLSKSWYHIPVDSAPKCWPTKYLAFYQGKAFGEEAYQIRYYGEVKDYEIVPRKFLFPDDEKNQHKAENLYYQVHLKSVEERPVPIFSYRPRRLVFIPTTWRKFQQAEQINDVFDDSPLEDRLWKGLKYMNIFAERQWKVMLEKQAYFLDFAIFCQNGKLAIETDGYTYHHETYEQIDQDKWRQNEIEIDGWRFLRYTTRQIKEDWLPYLTQIQKMVEQLGGLKPIFPISPMKTGALMEEIEESHKPGDYG